MLIRTVVAPLLAANCHLVLDGDRLWVVDPGYGTAPHIDALVRTEGVSVVGILLTHGHLDHTWDAAELSDRYDVAAHVHADDVYRLHDPVGTLGPVGVAVATMAGVPDGPAVPTRIEAFGVTGAAGVPFEVLHSPGHTEGSTVYLLEDDEGLVALTGDVLFAGSVGRTDFPGSDQGLMTVSLARLAALDPGTRVLPGHGPATTIGTEVATNPFLRTI